jgi:regulator of sigma E protease
LEEVKDVFGKSHLLARLGIVPDPEATRTERLAPFAAFREALLTELHLTGMTYQAVYYLATGQLSFKTVSGPLGIMVMTGTAAKMGLIYLLHLTAVLGISLAVINLLPIPALDGGHLIFLLIEALRGKGVSLEFQERLTQVGFALLMILMVFVLYNDLMNLQVFDRVKQVFAH